MTKLINSFISIFILSVSASAAAGPLETSYFKICDLVAEGKATAAQIYGVKQIQFIVKSRDCTESASRLWNMETLNLSRTDIESTDLFDGLDRLLFLFIETNPIKEIKISNMKSLRGLFASATEATTLNLTNLPSLREVRAGLSHISTVQIGKLPKIEIFDVSYNEIDNLEFTKNIPSTEKLFVSGNRLTVFDASSLVQLKMLEAHENQIRSVDAIRHNTVLEFIHFDNNLIVDLTPVSTLKYLYKIDFANNRITDVSPLVNSKLDYNTSLKLDGNPIGKTEAECPTLHNFLELRMFCFGWRELN